jgi:AraC-like DNA-binding protein
VESVAGYVDTVRNIPLCRRDGGRRVKIALEYLDGHFLENISLSELSDAAALSEFHLMRFFGLR